MLALPASGRIIFAVSKTLTPTKEQWRKKQTNRHGRFLFSENTKAFCEVYRSQATKVMFWRLLSDLWDERISCWARLSSMLRQDHFQYLFYFVHHTSQSSWLYYIRPVWFTNNLFLQLSRLSKALITFSALSVNRSLLRLLHCQHISHCVDATPTHCFLPVMVLRGTQHCSYRSTKHKEVEEGGRKLVWYCRKFVFAPCTWDTTHMGHSEWKNRSKYSSPRKSLFSH